MEVGGGVQRSHVISGFYTASTVIPEEAIEIGLASLKKRTIIIAACGEMPRWRLF